MKLRYLLLFPFVMLSCTNEVNEMNVLPEQEETNQDLSKSPEEPANPAEETDSLYESGNSASNDSIVWDGIFNMGNHGGSGLAAPEDFSNKLTIVTTGETPCSYETMRLLMLTSNEYDNFGIMSNTEECRAYFSFKRERLHEVDSIVKMEQEKGIDAWYTNYLYAGTREGAYICADTTLFGREAGEPLNDKFRVTSEGKSTWIRVSYPDFKVLANGYEEELPTAFDEVFKEGTALYPDYDSNYGLVLSLNETPAEQYEEIEFTLSIPIEGEYFETKFNHKDYEKYLYQEGHVVPNEGRVLEGSVMVKFK